MAAPVQTEDCHFLFVSTPGVQALMQLPCSTRLVRAEASMEQSARQIGLVTQKVVHQLNNVYIHHLHQIHQLEN